MEFLWPAALWGLALVAGQAAGVVWLSRRRVPRAWKHPWAAEAEGLPHRQRHVASLLYLGALATVVVGTARPVAAVRLPVRDAAVVLSIDVSGSMRSQDLLPNRLEAAKEAARAFLRGLSPGTSVGLVAFAGTAELLHPPTRDHARVLRTLDDLSFRPRTAIGEGLLEAVAALPGRMRRPGSGFQLDASAPPGTVVLLSDGRSNTGVDPLEAAEVARQQKVVVYTVGIGDPAPRDPVWTIGGPLDEETLKEIARRTGGEYFHATDSAGLSKVYRQLAYRVSWQTRREELSGLAALVAAVALVASWWAGSHAYRVL